MYNGEAEKKHLYCTKIAYRKFFPDSPSYRLLLEKNLVYKGLKVSIC